MTLIQEYAVELGIYHVNNIPPTVVMTTADVPVNKSVIPDHLPPNLWDLISDLRKAAELKLGAKVDDEQVFIRIFKR